MYGGAVYGGATYGGFHGGAYGADFSYSLQIDWQNIGAFEPVDDDLLSMNTWRGIDTKSTGIAKGAAGRLDAVLLNRDGQYSHFEQSSPLYGNNLPGRKIQVQFRFPHSIQWSGRVNSIDPQVQYGQLPKVHLKGSGYLADLAKILATVEPSAGGLTGAHVHSVLNAAGWPGQTIDFVGASGIGISGGGNTHNQGLPDDAKVGDLLLLFISQSDVIGTFNPSYSPENYGFTKIAGPISGSPEPFGWLYQKLHNGAEPAYYQFGWSTSRWSAGVILALRSQNPTVPIDVHVEAATVSGTNHATGSVTTSEENELIAAFYAVAAETSWTPPAAMSERADGSGGAGSDLTIGVATAIQTAAGASGVKTAASAAAGEGVTFLIGVRAADPVGTAYRRIDAGQQTTGRWYTFNKNALQALDELVATEMGYAGARVYESKDGALVFEDNLHRTLTPHTASQAAFSDADGAPLGYRRILEEDPIREIFNVIEVPVVAYTEHALAVLWTLPEGLTLDAGESRLLIAEFPQPGDETGAYVSAWTFPIVGTDIIPDDMVGIGGAYPATENSFVVATGIMFGNRVEFTISNTHTTEPISFGAGAGKIQVRGVAVRRAVSSLVKAEDIASQLKFGKRTLRLEDNYLALTSDGQAKAEVLRALYKDMHPREEIELSPTGSGLLLAQIINRDISDRITLTANGMTKLGISEDFFIEGVGLSFRKGSRLAATYSLSDADVSKPVFDAASSGTVQPGDVLTFPHTVGDHKDRLLVVGVGMRNGILSTSVTFGGIPMGIIPNGFMQPGGDVRAELWGLVNPPVGTFDVVVTVASSISINAGAVSYYRANQHNPFGTVVKTGVSGVGSISLPVPTRPDEIVVDVFADQSGSFTPTAGDGQNQRVLELSTNNDLGMSDQPATNPSTSMDWTTNAGDVGALIAVPVRS